MDNAWLRRYNGKARMEHLPDHAVAHWTKEGFEELLEVTEKIVDSINSSEKIKSAIDVGCGPGNYCSLLKKKGIKIIGLDYSEAMIKRASSKYPDIKFVLGNGYNLTFSDRSFDLVLSIGAITCLADHERFIKELKRIAKKYVILSTLLRDNKVKNIKKYLSKKLEDDSWPTMDYHPSELIPLFENEFEVKIITHNKDKLIADGFFLVAKRKKT